MTSNETPTDGPTAPPHRRRSSFAELFASRPIPDAGRPQPSAMSATMAQQAQEQSRARRLSITTLGLSGASSMQNNNAPFSALRQGKREGPGSVDGESAIEEDSVPPMGSENGERRTSGPGSPLGRRLSLGARAYREARSASIGMPAGQFSPGADGGVSTSAPSGKPGSPPGLRGSEGFSWADNFRNRAERASISGGSGAPGVGTMGHQRTVSQTSADTQPKAVPPPPVKQVAAEPDHFQERILRNDFYMD